MTKHRAGLTDSVIQAQLNSFTPAAADASLGDVLYALLNAHNALLAKLDTANLAGMSNNNAATFSVVLPGQR